SAGRHMKGMVGVGKKLQCRARAELFDEWLQQLQVRKLVAGSLHEQHRDLNIEEVLATLVRWPPGRMKREPKEGDASDSRQWRCSLRLRCHAAAEGFTTRNEGKIRRQTGHFRDRCADGGMGEFGRVRPL